MAQCWSVVFMYKEYIWAIFTVFSVLGNGNPKCCPSTSILTMPIIYINLCSCTYTHKKAHVKAVFILHSLCKLQMVRLLFFCSEISIFSMFLVLYMTSGMWQWHLSEGGLISRTVCDFQSGRVQRHSFTHSFSQWGSASCVSLQPEEPVHTWNESKILKWVDLCVHRGQWWENK